MQGWKPAGPPSARPSEYAEKVLNGGDYAFSPLDARRAFLVGNRDQRDRIAKIWRNVASRLEPDRYAVTLAGVEEALKRR